MTSSTGVVKNCETTVNTKIAEHSASNGGVPDTLQNLFTASLHQHNVTQVLVAYSGGLDSHLLLLLARQWCVDDTVGKLRAIYIDHGLQDHSHAWGSHCARVCADLDIDFDVVPVQVELDSDESPEEAARTARYRALTTLVRHNEYLLTGHHADDQAETLLLQLVRGAGVKGLSAMPKCKPFGAGHHLRPLLDCPVSLLAQAGSSLGLNWIEDPSNADERFDRNLIRHRIMPLLRQRWPSIAESLSRSASHCQEAAALSGFAAERTLGDAIHQSQLRLDVFEGQSRLQRKNIIRHWIDCQGYRLPSTAQLDRILDDILNGSEESAGTVYFADAQLQRFRNTVYLGPRGAFDNTSDFDYQWPDIEIPLTIIETGQVLTKRDVGFSEDTVVTLPVQVRNRRGGERIQLQGHAHSKSVKALLRERGIPPWLRCRLPFVYIGGTLAAIVGVSVSAHVN